MGSNFMLGDGSFGAFTFYAREHQAEECNSHGLPLTPNTILMTGRFEGMRNIQHNNLCAYLDLLKCNGERMVCVSEYYKDSLETRMKQKYSFTHLGAAQLAAELTDALSYLHERNMAASFLCTESVLFNKNGNVKLFNYGFCHITDYGNFVDFALESPRYISPELLLSQSKDLHIAMATKSNIWSLGIILLEVFMECHLYPDLFLKNGLATLFTCLLRFVRNSQRGGATPLDGLLETHGLAEKPMDTNLKSFLELCLVPLPSKRSSAHSLLSHVYLKVAKNKKDSDNLPKLVSIRNPFDGERVTEKIEVPSPYSSSSMSTGEANVILKEDHLSSCSLQEVYFLWSLAGGDLNNELSKASLVTNRPPVLSLPCVVAQDIKEFGVEEDSIHLYDDTVVTLPMEQLRKRLQSKGIEDYYPIMPDPEVVKNDRRSVVNDSEQLLQLSKLPLQIKEKDIDYQFHRLILYRRLLEAYPYTKELIITEAIVDVCPLNRGPIWAALLDVHGDIVSRYDEIDKESATPTDRQIAVDIPRCHQYHLLLASTTGQFKFNRLLKAWVRDHPHLVYWQGLDSLCAPFLSLNFNDEALAYASFCSFIDKYLTNFFLKDNSPVMQEYLAIFLQLIAYHDPVVFNRLDTIGFFPDLYAIPWFLTMFTHVFPLDKVYHLWDTLLLGNPSFPLFVGVSILVQLRNELLSYDFNECIMMFSDLPDINIHQCVTEAGRLYHITPPSLYLRTQGKPQEPLDNFHGPPEACKVPLSIESLRLECSPQLSAHDLISLCKLESRAIGYERVSKTPPNSKDPNDPLLWRDLGTKGRNGEVIVIDIRTQEEFESGHMMSSYNLPHYEGTFLPNGDLTGSPETACLREREWDFIVILAGKGDQAATFARQLVRLNFHHVCTLNGGAGVLRSLGLLSSVLE
ncbi:PREDICTED: TBC domain-containing protein kinase-like protein [Amphimedon queenslandica]|uniref:TBC domain-containing protein kinase-like protein n=1 Tax=Amphimedon queenslandica TaxID=400682 RepID=A0A1X7VIY3_AMPQE|nr:PREDICTED: TBC domain-containing protein kinase-like protein [Amphimedon queenslandica]|eukprot:XP_011410154.1 PREDICTED: TBC domain-containing protein kinase-like protein [Amphimedon queenslandica]